MRYKEPSGTQESAGRNPEKIVVHVKTISEIRECLNAHVILLSGFSRSAP